MPQSKARSHCALCHVPLSTIPREVENGNSCLYAWHNSDMLMRRVYKTKSGTGAQRERDTSREPEAAAEPSPAPGPNSSGEPSAGVREFRARHEALKREEEERTAVQQAVDKVIRQLAVHGKTHTSVRRLLRTLQLVLPQGFQWTVNENLLQSGAMNVRKELRRGIVLLHPANWRELGCRLSKWPSPRAQPSFW